MHNFNEYLCKHNVRKKNVGFHFLPTTKCNERKMKGISAAGACSLAIFEHHPLDTKTETCSFSFKCNHTRDITNLAITNEEQNLDYLRPINSKGHSCHVMFDL
jgi:hypothetical protein